MKLSEQDAKLFFDLMWALQFKQHSNNMHMLFNSVNYPDILILVLKWWKYLRSNEMVLDHPWISVIASQLIEIVGNL